MRWILGIVLAMLTVVAVNGLFLYKALQNPVQVEASYVEGKR